MEGTQAERGMEMTSGGTPGGSGKGDEMARAMVMNTFLKGRAMQEIMDWIIGAVFGIVFAGTVFALISDNLIAYLVLGLAVVVLVPSAWFLFIDLHRMIQNALDIAGSDTEDHGGEVFKEGVKSGEQKPEN